MAEIADWQRKNYKKVQSFADGGLGEIQAPVQQPALSEDERQAQEEARDLSTIKDVDLGKDKKKEGMRFAPIPAGTIEVKPDRYEAPTPYQEGGRYTARIMAAAGMADGGVVKRGKR